MISHEPTEPGGAASTIGIVPPERLIILVPGVAVRVPRKVFEISPLGPTIML